MNRKDISAAITAVCIGTAVVSFAGIGVYLANPETVQPQIHEQALLGRHHTWLLIRDYDPLNDRESQCFIASGIPWSPAGLTVEGQALAFAPGLGLSINTSSLLFNLTTGDLRISLPLETLGRSAKRRLINAARLKVRVDEAGVLHIIFNMMNDSDTDFRHIPLDEDGISELISEMAQGKRIFAQWSVEMGAVVGAASKGDVWVSTYFLPLNGFYEALEHARTSCRNPGYAVAEPTTASEQASNHRTKLPIIKTNSFHESATVADTAALEGSRTAEPELTPVEAAGTLGPPVVGRLGTEEKTRFLGEYGACSLDCE